MDNKVEKAAGSRSRRARKVPKPGLFIISLLVFGVWSLSMFFFEGANFLRKIVLEKTQWDSESLLWEYHAVLIMIISIITVVSVSLLLERVKRLNHHLRTKHDKLVQAQDALRKVAAQFEFGANYDALTGLPNRLLLADRLKQAMSHGDRRGKSIAVMYIDLDGFKEINDIHGHSAGDELLVLISQRMQEVVREGDTVARIGGDEFVIVLSDLDKPQSCEPVLERLLKDTSEVVTLSTGQGVYVSASVGVTVYPEDSSDREELIRHADFAMYLAKRAGGNRYCLFDIGRDHAAVQVRFK